MRSSIDGWPLPSTLSTWLSHHDGKVLSTNPASIVSVDLLPGTGRNGTCIMDCAYCYGCRGHQAYRQARELQRHRSEVYRESPVIFAQMITIALRRLNAHFGLRIGSETFPLRLFGNGDGIDREHLERFANSLRSYSIAFYGYSRIDCRVPELALSIDRDVLQDRGAKHRILRARAAGRSIVYVRLSEDDIAPRYVNIVFPEHNARKRIPVDPRDCYKLRHNHSVGVCYKCRRCINPQTKG